MSQHMPETLGAKGVSLRVIYHTDLNANTIIASPNTDIMFSIKEDAEIKVTIYNTKGQKVKTFDEGVLQKGIHSISWNGRDSKNEPVTSGIYLYKVSANDKSVKFGKSILVK